MAKRRVKPKMHTQRFLYYDLEHSGNGEDAHYIDLAKDLSAVNRRLYRQGRNYSISNVSIHDSNGDARVLFSTAPNTWALHAAWELLFNGWKKQRAETLALSDGNMKSPRWSDFKLYLNKEHVIDTDWPKPTEDENQDITLGEWDMSDMAFWRQGIRYDNFAAGLMGGHEFAAITNETTPHDALYGGYISALEALQEIRSTPVDSGDDGAVAQGLMFTNFDGGAIEDQLIELQKEGDLPPYSLDIVGSSNNPAADTGAWPVREVHISSTYAPMAMTGPIPNIPCGLLQIETTAGENNTIGLLIELTPGDYLGVHAPRMNR